MLRTFQGILLAVSLLPAIVFSDNTISANDTCNTFRKDAELNKPIRWALALASCYAELGQIQKTKTYLTKAFESGFTDLDYIEHAPGYSYLRSSDSWEQYRASLAKYEDTYFKKINFELHKIMKRDQCSRGIHSRFCRKEFEHDRERVARVKEMIANNELIHADDYANAALIMHHGNEISHLKTAMALSKRAVELGSKQIGSKQMVCATEDRYLLRIGQPQVWGTQFLHMREKVTIESFAGNHKTDEERAECNLLPLREYIKRVNETLRKNEVQVKK